MKRNNLTTAVLAGLAGVAGIATTAQAVNLNPDGLGQVLIYPYYTTNGGNDTLMSVVNSTDEAKAVKVRYLEGQNSQEVLDFNLYLSAFDVWVAAITQVDDLGTPGIIIPDSSCTVPYLFEDAGGVQAFQDILIGGDISRATEGHIELIEMGVLLDDADSDGPMVGQGSATAVTHVDTDTDLDGTADARRPNDCQQLVDAFSTIGGVPGYWIDDINTDLSAPSGGMFGRAAVVDVADGVMYSYDARAVDGFSSDIEHAFPGSIFPNLNSGSETEAYLFFDQDGDAVPEPLAIDFDDGEDDDFDSVDAVSAVFMRDTLSNEYNTADALNAQSEWVITFPTKNFYVNVTPDAPGGDAFRKPFTSAFTVGEGACEVVEFAIYDREEATVAPGSTGPGISPQPEDPEVPQFELCFESQVVRFGELPVGLESTEIFGSSNFTNINNADLARPATDFSSGWLRMDFSVDPDHELEGDFVGDASDSDQFGDGDNIQLVGLPVTGFWAVRFVNGVLDGGATLANYGGLFSHKYTRLVECNDDSDGDACGAITPAGQ